MINSEAEALFLLFSRIYTATILIPIVVAIWQWKYLNKVLKVFLTYRVLAFLFNLLEQIFIYLAYKHFEVIQPFVTYWGIKDTNFLAILYQLNAIAFLGWFYLLLLPSKYKFWLKWITILIFMAVSINYFFIEGYLAFGKFNPNTTAIFSFGIASIYLWFIYKFYLTLPLAKNPYFWLSFGVIIPYLVGFFLELIGEVIHEENFNFFVTLSVLKNCFLIIGQFLMAIGFWRARYAQYLSLPEEKANTV
ncbi:MAG: hypothetical protein ACK4TA_08470 [Saprospiraceae bacterium]